MALGQFTRFNLTFELDRVVPEHRVCVVLEPIMGELEKLLIEGSPKVRKEAQIAVNYAKNNCQKWPSDYTHKNVDFILIYYAEKYKGIVATNDRLLKRIARKKGVKTLFIRNQTYLMLQ
jgi:rRNA-processing protein FCF1